MFKELKKALTTAGDGEALVVTDMDAILHEELLKLQPLTQLLQVSRSEGKTHEYKVKTSHPQAWFEGETSGSSVKNGAYQRKTVMLKIARIWGEVTGFAQAVDDKFIDALEEEVKGSLQGMSDLIEYGVLFGTANDIGFTGDEYQFSGAIPRMMAYAPANVVDAGGDKISLDDLDQAILKVSRHRQTKNDPRLLMMGQRMKQVVDGLQTKVQMPLNGVELMDGRLKMAAYGDTPIFESDLLTPEDTTTSPACTGAVAAGGALEDDTYNYRISSVTMFGEQVAGTASANVTAATTNKSADLTWTADANAVSYIIWRKRGAGSYQLLDIIPAKTYNADGEVTGSVESYSDEGALTPKAIKPLESGEQNIAVLNINPARGLSIKGLVDDMGRPMNSMVSFIELARVKDTYPYMLKSYSAAKLVYPNLVSLIRHAKVA